MDIRQFFIIVFLSIGIPGIAQDIEINRNCREAYKQILALDFVQGRKTIELEETENPGNLYVEYLDNYIDFLTVFISENNRTFDSISVVSDKRYDLLKEIGRDNPYRNYLLGNMNLQWAVMRLKFNDYFYAALNINRAYRLLTGNKETFPNFVPNDITLGVLHIMIGMVPNNYQWVLRLINMKGSVTRGRQELMMALSTADTNPEYSYLKNEILFFMGFVELNINPKRQQLERIYQQIAMADSDNLLISYLQINILMKTGRNEQALNVFERVSRMNGYTPFYYLDYLQGECLLRKLDTKKASKYYNRFIDRFNGKNYLKDAWRKKAWIALLENDSAGYFKNLAKVSETGNDDIGQDRDAEREFKENAVPNIFLIKARLLFDGGYYYMADSILSLMPANGISREEQLEKTYRAARIADESGRTDDAKILYDNTIREGKNSPRYFAGNSALKLAEIYETEGKFTQALHYYNLCLDLDFDEYEAGIHGKAKAGVRRISDTELK